jgi:hypothetical protein
VCFVLDAVKESVLSPDTAAYGRGRKAGVITPVDVEVIRTVIHGGGGFGTYTVTVREADLLFQLNDATVEAENADSWRELFVKGVGSYLMCPLAEPIVPDAEEVLRLDAWLEQRRTYGDHLRDLCRGLRDLKSGESLKELDPFGIRRRGEEAARAKTRSLEATARESIDGAEASWLIDRLDRDDALTENERALLGFIKENSLLIHPSLNKLFGKAGL